MSLTPVLRCYSWARERPEAAPGEDHLHAPAARHPGGPLPEDEVPRHLHARGGGHQDQPARESSPGEQQGFGCQRCDIGAVLGHVSKGVDTTMEITGSVRNQPN